MPRSNTHLNAEVYRGPSVVFPLLASVVLFLKLKVIIITTIIIISVSQSG